ncbi:MAG: redoxin domain-containing protein [Planctomycetia bacterium]|nr:redoxin domain-containing protein [Planctomycetia bacterium]
MRRHWLALSVLGVACFGFSSIAMTADDSPTPEYIFSKFIPRQRDVEVETPKPAEYAKCVIKSERIGKATAWVVTGANGQVLRRFVDTNSDGTVDQWRYFNNGLEVYREIDNNFNEKPDQYRWLNTGGTRWGIDSNEDKIIDEWRLLSAEETSRVAINAFIAEDTDALRLVLINSDDLEKLKVEESVAKALLANVSSPAQKLRDALSKSKSLSPRARWMRFDVASAMPSLIPADEGKAGIDLILYENAMAIIETEAAAPKNSLLVQIGELIKVGDVWKLTQIPLPIEGNQVQLAAGVLMQPGQSTAGESAASASPGGANDPRVAELVKKLQDLDTKAPGADAVPADFVRFNTLRSTLLKQIINITKGADQENWIKQLIDGLASAVQTGVYEDGLRELKQLEAQLKQQAKANVALSAYVTYRRMLAEYAVAVQQAKTSAQQAKTQEDWIKDLTSFVQTYPKSEDTPDVMMQLATGLEFAGKAVDAKKWFSDLADKFPDTSAGKKATGALVRLDAKGKPLPLAFAGLEGGKVDIRNYRGKAVLVVFWATWCKPCAQDLPKLRAMYQQYRNQGFEVIGVNLDNQPNGVKVYMQQNGMTWPQVFEPGGLQSAPSQAFGVISLPTMFLTDKQGLVHSRPASMDDVTTALPELLGLKKPMAAAANTTETN